MMRRAFALFVSLCLLAGFFALPVTPTLVCRITGMPMGRADATAKSSHSCCAVAVALAANGDTQYALKNPGCCDLRQSPTPPLPQLAAAFDSDWLSFAWSPAPAVLHIPMTMIPVVSSVAENDAAPRAPPRPGVPPRAPPVFS